MDRPATVCALSRRDFLRLAVTAGGWVAAGGAGTFLVACGRADEAPTKATVPYTKGLHEPADGVYVYLQPDGGWGLSNAGLIVGGDGTSMLVDTLTDLRLTGEMLDAMRADIPAASRITTVVNTHADGDHTFGNQLVDGADIVSSSTTAADMAKAIPPATLAAYLANPPAGVAGEFAKVALPFRYDDIRLTPPSRTFDGQLDLRVGRRRVSLLELGPAHSGSDIVVHIPDAKVVFAGDLVFNGVHPLMTTGPVKNWLAGLDRILALGPRVVVPGHGPVADVAAIGVFRSYLRWITEQAAAAHDKGMVPLDAARSILDSDNAYAAWLAPERIVVNVTTVYRDLGDNPPSDLFPTLTELMATLWKERNPS